MIRHLKLEKINDTVVKKVKLTREVDPRPIKGAQMFDKLYCNIFINAPPRSGKTTTLYNMINACCTKETVVVAFCSTLDADDTWYEIEQNCIRRGITFIGHTSIFDDDGINQVEVLVDFLKGKAKERRDSLEKEKREKEEKKEEKKKNQTPSFFDEPKPEKSPQKKKTRKSKFQAPEYFIVFDDLPGLLKNPAIAALMKKFRHYRVKCAILAHYICDLLPGQTTMLDYALVFKGVTGKKLDDLRKMIASNVDEEDFLELYENATEKKHSFLYVDCREGEFRKNFNEKYIQ